MYKLLIMTLLYILYPTEAILGLPPTQLGGQDQTAGTTFNFKVPYSQTTSLGGVNRLIETDNENMLVNPSFEHGTVATGWTLGTSNTLTATTTSANLFSGKQAGALTTSATVAFSLKQNLTPVSGVAGTQGEVTWAMAVPSGVTDGQICSLVNDVEISCISVINNGVYREYNIPVVFGTAGQSAGVKFKTTATYASGTQTIYVDKARVRAGIPTQNLSLDNVYSAQVTSTSGTVANLSKASWVSCSAANPTVCTFATGIFTVEPNCVAEIFSTTYYSTIITASTSTAVTVKTVDGGTGLAAASIPFKLICQKQGVDYTTASSAVYSQASANYDWTTYTPTFTGFGTLSSTLCKHKRDGGDLLVNCQITMGTVSGTLASVTLPGSLSIDSSKIGATNTTANPGQVVGMWEANGASGNNGGIVTATGTSTSLLYWGNIFGSTTNLTPQNGSTITNSGNYMSFNFRVPISGWTDANQIIGSFSGVPAVPGLSGRVDAFSVSYGATATTVCSTSPCAYIDQIGDAVNATTGVARISLGTVQLTTIRTYAKLKCVVSASEGTGSVSLYTGSALSCSNCTQVQFDMANTSVLKDTYGIFMCQGSY